MKVWNSLLTLATRRNVFALEISRCLIYYDHIMPVDGLLDAVGSSLKSVVVVANVSKITIL